MARFPKTALPPPLQDRRPKHMKFTGISAASRGYTAQYASPRVHFSPEATPVPIETANK
jgi:hypothetical protein